MNKTTLLRLDLATSLHSVPTRSPEGWPLDKTRLDGLHAPNDAHLQKEKMGKDRVIAEQATLIQVNRTRRVLLKMQSRCCFLCRSQSKNYPCLTLIGPRQGREKRLTDRQTDKTHRHADTNLVLRKFIFLRRLAFQRQVHLGPTFSLKSCEF